MVNRLEPQARLLLGPRRQGFLAALEDFARCGAEDPRELRQRLDGCPALAALQIGDEGHRQRRTSGGFIF